MRTMLLSFLAFVSVTAISAGSLMINDPGGASLNLSVNLLDGTPFNNYLVPGLVLTVIVGGLNFFALLLAGTTKPSSCRFAIAGGMAVIAWVVLQMLFTQTYHWLQLLYLAIGFLIILLSYQLMGKAAF